MGKVVETIYGKHSKYEIIAVPGGPLSSTSYVIYRNGSWFKGSYSSLRTAVAAAERAG
jgi:hypothetical protein